MQPFVVSIKGLKPGKSHYEWQIGGEFFKTFENSEVLDADLQVSVDLTYSGSSAEATGRIQGTVVVVCGRCLEDLSIPVDTEFELEDGEIDLVGDTISLGQDVYDFVCVSLPMQRVHPEGYCNEQTVKYLSK